MSVHRLARATVLTAGYVERLFTERHIYLRKSTCSDIALAALLRNACKSSRAIAHLARAGYGSNTLALSRSLAEIWITIRWLTNKETESRARAFLAFDSKQRERIIELLDTHYPEVDLDRFKRNRHHDLQAQKYKRWDTWGPGISKMANEEESLEEGQEGVASPKWTHEVTFFISSYHLHPTSLGLRHHFQTPGEFFSFRQQNDEEKFAIQGLVSTIQCLSRSASRVGLFWGVSIDETLSTLWQKYIDPLILTPQ